ncbi:hypothetical protein BKD30_04565 [Tersicoccus phoenicis]|uniref:Bacterial bifunctional deaminase-reductase C-terminal domain-containing protein n=1 Tax=Tersicoccus phoenicis TaxID=554083 RepID=A0A1R1LGJ5_9MICC|nr:dihydrofolate reductase family protein [Tersicoccus phoenicis]OMH26668.1 hypothetical protein BKD30_04565 [Tersicoccus phoenicis]
MSTTVTADLLVSVDGWARGLDSPGFFGYAGPELMQWIGDQSAAHHDLMGRRTYEMLASMPADERETRTTTTVFSRTLRETTWENTTIESGDAIEAVRELRSASLPLRTVGSLSLVRQLLDAGLVDRLRLWLFPLLVGPGGREAALAGVGERDLDLVDHRVLDGRIILLEYAPTDRGIPHASATDPAS